MTRPTKTHELGPGIAPYNKRTTERHVIAAVHYAPKTDPDVAPLECTCGWSGLAGGFRAHRLASGVRQSRTGWEAMAFSGYK